MRSVPDRDITGLAIADATTPGFPLVHVSPGFERLTGYRAPQVLGRSCSFLQGPETDLRSVEVLSAALAAQREAYVLLLNYRADGSPFWNEVTLTPRFGSDGRLMEYFGVQKDVTNRREAEARVRELTFVDATTGLPNRIALANEVEAAIVASARGERPEAVLVLIDLEDLEEVNRERGERIGDALLKAAAGRLGSLARVGDLVARAGENQFGLLLRGLVRGAAPGAAERFADRVLSVLGEPFNLDGTRLTTRAAVGACVVPGGASTGADALTSAKSALAASRSPTTKLA